MAVSSLSIPGAGRAGVTFTFTASSSDSEAADRSGWLDTVGFPSTFATEAANVALADEVLLVPTNNTVGLGGASATLTFPSSSTEIPWSFTLSAPGSLSPLDATTGFTYNDIDGSSSASFLTGTLSPGDIDNHEDDDIHLAITGGPPLLAVGFEVVNSGAFVGVESISVYGDGDVLLGTFDIPAHGLSPADVNIFVGIVSTDPIKRVEFDEDDTADDVALRDLWFAGQIGANPYAEVVVDYSPVIVAGEPFPVNRDSSNAIGAPDFQPVPNTGFVTLGDGGTIELQFTDNSVSGSGDSAPDLKIYEVGGDVEDTFVSISQDGVAWYSVGSVSGSTSTIDLDAFGFGPQDDFFFVLLTDDPNEGDQTGGSVGADIDAIEALSGHLIIEDADFDFIADSVDNCPDLYNPSQEDEDNDGVGDFCDNCKYDPNPGQENTGGIPLAGDACDPAVLSLVGVAMAGAPTFDLELRCGGLPIAEINYGLRLPFGVVPATADFGGGCDEPVVPPAGGIPAGSGCTANPDLGANVDAANSGAYGPGLASPFSSETLYVQIRGNGVGGRLCDAYSPTPVLLGRFTTGPASSFSGASALLTQGLTASGLESALDTNGQPASIGDFNSGPGDPVLEIILKPAAGEDELTATRWSLCISGDTDQRMHRISAGLRIVGATSDDIRVDGCDTTPIGGVRACTGTVAATVDNTNSFTAGPYASPTAPVVNDTLYVVVEGSASAPGATTLNPTQFQEWCVATIEVDAPPGILGVPPEFVTDGLETLPFTDMTTDPWQTSSTLLDPLTLEQVALGNGFNPGDDLDGDGVLDAADNCRFIANVDVVTGELPNNGDFQVAGLNVDDDGDACECGDANGSGAVFDAGTPDPTGSPLTPDLDIIRAYLVGNNTDPGVASVCSVYEGVECNTKDAVVLQRALNAQAPGITPRCDAALPD